MNLKKKKNEAEYYLFKNKKTALENQFSKAVFRLTNLNFRRLTA